MRGPRWTRAHAQCPQITSDWLTFLQVNVELPEAARLQAEIEEKEGQVGMLEHHIQNLEMQIYRYEFDYIVYGDRTSSSPL